MNDTPNQPIAKIDPSLNSAPPMPAIDNAVDALRNGGTGGIPPQLTTSMSFREIGSLGLRQFSGWVREEFLPQLQGRQGAQKYREMLDNNGIIGAIMFSVISTMRKIEWRVKPADDTPAAQEKAEFVESLQQDMSHTWEDFIVESLSMLGYGFAPHEIVYKRRLGREPGADPQRPGKMLPKSKFDDGLVGWRRLPIRGQDTVIKWFFDENGVVEGMTQQPWTGPLIDLPIQKMLLFRPSQHKGNPEGRSILRNAYRSYYFIKRLEEQEAILFERLNGIPVLRVPSALLQAANSGDPVSVAALNAFKRIAINLRIDEQMGIVLPSDVWPGANGPSSIRQYDIELVTPQSGRMSVNANETIGRYQTNMLTSVLADFLSMGHSARGAQNLGETKIDLFNQGIEGFLNSNASVINEHGLTRLWELNGFDFDLMPEIVPDLATRVDLDMLGTFVQKLSQSGMPLFPDEELQSYLRDAAGLPEETDPAAMEALQNEMDMQQAAAEAKLNPPAPSAAMQKVIKGLLGRALRKHGGPKFGIHTHKHK